MEFGGKRFWIAAALILAILVPGQNHGLWRHGEQRVLETAREMYLSGNWAVPTYSGETFLEKPPLAFASAALVFSAAGKANENRARIPFIFYAALAVLATMLLGRRVGGGRAGLMAGLILLTNPLFFIRSHQCSIDVVLAAFVTICLTSFFFIYRPGKARYGFLELVPMYLFAALAFYTKSFVGIILPGVAIVSFLLWMRDYRGMWAIKPWFGALLFAALLSPWFVDLWRQGGDEYLKIVFLDNALYRFVQTSHSNLGHHTRWYWYFETIWKLFEPWSILLIPAAVMFSRRSFPDRFAEGGRGFLAMWFISMFLFLTMSSTKREVYLMPLMPAASLAVALWIEERVVSDGPKWEQWFGLAFGVLVLGLSAALPVICTRAPGGSAWSLLAAPPALGLSIAAFYFLAKKNRGRYYSLIMGSVWVLGLSAAIFYIPVHSLGADASSFAKKAGEYIKGAKVVYTMYEHNTLGYIPFYTGKRVEKIEQTMDLKALVESGAPVYYVTVAQKKDAIEDNLEYLRGHGLDLELLLKEPIDGRESALWRVLPSGREGGGG